MKRIKLDLWDCYVYFLWMMVVHRLENSAIVVINGFAKNTLQLSWAVREPMIYVILAVLPITHANKKFPKPLVNCSKVCYNLLILNFQRKHTYGIQQYS